MNRPVSRTYDSATVRLAPGPTELRALAQAFDLSEADIEDAAEKLAGQVRFRAELWQINGQSEADSLRALQQIAHRHHIGFPAKETLAEDLNRMTQPAWWRRALRLRFRFVEQAERRRGAVHDKASRYVSVKALRRRERAVRRLADWMAAMQAVNLTTGETIGLDELIAGSQANPANRRAAMMVRSKGIESSARDAGHQAAFLTITAPGRMHERHQTGAAVARSEGADPRQVHSYLCSVWQRAMRKARHEGLTTYGLRIVEPHHDGCPHWHALVFAPPADVGPLVDILRAYAMADSPGEPGAAEHRFKVEHIDPAKGSALSYVAKYISKSIDGEGVDQDHETGATGADAARRIVTWAGLWGIRQFQFFGQPPITPFRELYRHDGQGIEAPGLIEAHRACKANDYGAYLNVRKVHGVDLRVRFITRPSTRYPGELTKAIRGLDAIETAMAAPLVLTTRTENWAIEPRPVQSIGDASAPPWTRSNKSAPSMESTGCKRSMRSPAAAGGRSVRDGRRRRPSATAGPPLTAA